MKLIDTVVSNGKRIYKDMPCFPKHGMSFSACIRNLQGFGNLGGFIFA
jgi:hypothetical protein